MYMNVRGALFPSDATQTQMPFEQLTPPKAVSHVFGKHRINSRLHGVVFVLKVCGLIVWTASRAISPDTIEL